MRIAHALTKTKKHEVLRFTTRKMEHILSNRIWPYHTSSSSATCVTQSLLDCLLSKFEKKLYVQQNKVLTDFLVLVILASLSFESKPLSKYLHQI
jgi:hypothetical protein